MELLTKLLFVFFLTQWTYKINCESTNSNNADLTEGKEQEKPKSNLLAEFVSYLKNNSIHTDDVLTPNDVETHLTNMFHGQIPKDTKEYYIFGRLAVNIAKEIPQPLKVSELGKYFVEEELIKKLRVVYEQVLEEINKTKIEKEQKDKEKEKVNNKEPEKAPDEVVDLGDITSEDKEYL